MTKAQDLKPIAGRVLIEPNAAAETSRGGIIIAATVEGNRSQTGTILAVADDVTGFAVGEKVLFNELAMESRVIRLSDGEKERDYLLTETDYIMAKI